MVLGVNTARSNVWKSGRLSHDQIESIRSHFSPLPERVFKVLVTHHPFLPPPGAPSRRLVGAACRRCRSRRPAASAAWTSCSRATCTSASAATSGPTTSRSGDRSSSRRQGQPRRCGCGANGGEGLGTHAAAGGDREEETGRGIEASPRPEHRRRVAPHPGRSQTRRLAARPRPVCLCREEWQHTNCTFYETASSGFKAKVVLAPELGSRAG